MYVMNLIARYWIHIFSQKKMQLTGRNYNSCDCNVLLLCSIVIISELQAPIDPSKSMCISLQYVMTTEKEQIFSAVFSLNHINPVWKLHHNRFPAKKKRSFGSLAQSQYI